MPLSSSTSLRFGPDGRFELQSAERRLFVDGRPAALGARALDLLITLAAQPDHLLRKSELLDRVWPGLVVEEANLQMQISNLRKLLGGDVIATVPGRGYRFVAALQAVDAAPVVAAGVAVASALAPASATPSAPRQRLFGRDADLARLQALLQRGGCVTLVGTAGVGKTSLARAAAAAWQGRSVWVDLASLAEGAQVAPALARALGAPLDEGDAAPQLLHALQGQTLLLVLDNAEHVVHTCAELATLLRPLAGVHLLVTSQLPLAVAGEQLQRLEPLALPGAGAGAGTDAAASDGALALLVERINAADHRFSADAQTLPLLAAVCTQLDGLPLALEMAAARVPLLGLQAVHDALAERFALLTRGHRDAAQRHRSLHGALDWSYRLLAAPEQRLLRALAVFSGGFTLELAVALMTDDAAARWDLIDGLAALADRSLLVVGSGDPPQYRLLETVRLFALEQLKTQTGADAENVVRRCHAGAVLALFKRREPGQAAAQTQAQVEAEMDNARAAITWAREHDLGLAAELTVAVAPVSNFTVWRQEATDWLLALEPLMQGAVGHALPAAVQASWWTELARMLSIRRDKRAAAVACRALALWAPLNEPRRALFASVVWVRSVGAAGPELDAACTELQARAAALPDLSVRERLQVQGALAVAASEREDLPAVLSGRLNEMALAQELGLQQVVDGAESNVVFALLAMHRHAEAAERGRALLARVDSGEASTQGNLPWVLQGLLTALVMQERLDEALALAPRAWAACRRFDTPVVVPTLAQLAALQGRYEAAGQLIGHARARFEARSSEIGVVDVQAMAQAEALAHTALGTVAAHAAVQRGRELEDAEAEVLALGTAAAQAA